MGKTILLSIVLLLQTTSSFAFHSTLTCKAINDYSNNMTLRVTNKILKRIDRNTSAVDAPVMYFDRHNDDKTHMVYVTESKMGHDIALPTRDWEPRDEYILGVEMVIGEREVVNRIPEKKVTKYKCITAPTLTGF
ncbi:MAG: hypothetical protein KA715_00370 [Xanthomonadaceae bacterium]|nr:hypothetical protein [Xanthomonadaceae bacterium]